MIGCDQSTVQRAESLHSSAKIKTYTEYANALGMKLHDLFSEDVTPDEVELLRIFRRAPASKHDEIMAILRLAREEIDGEAQ